MKDVVALFESKGCSDVRTYIQSGNVVFDCKAADTAKIAEDVAGSVLRQRGFEPRIVIMSRQDLEKAVAANPYPEAAKSPKTLHLYLLVEVPSKADLQAMSRLKARNERFSLIDRVFYLHAPDGIGRSKLAARVEKLLGVEATARNWRTVVKVLELACD